MTTTTMPGNGKTCGVFDAGIPHPAHAWIVQRVGFACPGLGVLVYFDDDDGTEVHGMTARPPAASRRTNTDGLVWVDYPWSLDGRWHEIDTLRSMPRDVLSDEHRKLLVAAYGLLGDGLGGEWGDPESNEYTRGIAELIADVVPFPTPHSGDPDHRKIAALWLVRRIGESQ